MCLDGLYEPVDVGQQFPSVFPACTVTRAQSRKFDDVLDVSETFMTEVDRKECVQDVSRNVCVFDQEVAVQVETILEAGRESLAAAQKADISLAKCLAGAVQKDEAVDKDVAYDLEDECSCVSGLHQKRILAGRPCFR